MNRNVLAVSWAMPPLLLPRALQISRLLEQWSRHDWKTRVLTVSPPSLRDSVQLDQDLATLYNKNYQLSLIESPERQFFWRALFALVPILRNSPDEKRCWAERAARTGLELHAKNPASVLISFAQPWSSHVAGLKIHQQSGLPWIAHFSDPWTAGPHVELSGWSAREARRWEAKVIQTATRLVFVNQQTADVTLAKYSSELKTKVRIVPHGFDRDILQGLRFKTASPFQPLRMVHSGNFYGTRTPWGFLQALSDLNRDQPLTQKLEVAFVGYLPPEFISRAQELGLAGVVKSLGPKSYLPALQALRDADVLLLIEAASAHDNLYFPSKLVDYFLFQKPIFGLTPARGPSATLLRELGCPAVEPNNIPEIRAALKKLLDEKEAGQLRVSEQFTAIVEAYDIRRTAALFEQILEELVPK